MSMRYLLSPWCTTCLSEFRLPWNSHVGHCHHVSALYLRLFLPSAVDLALIIGEAGCMSTSLHTKFHISPVSQSSVSLFLSPFVLGQQPHAIPIRFDQGVGVVNFLDSLPSCCLTDRPNLRRRNSFLESTRKSC